MSKQKKAPPELEYAFFSDESDEDRHKWTERDSELHAVLKWPESILERAMFIRNHGEPGKLRSRIKRLLHAVPTEMGIHEMRVLMDHFIRNFCDREFIGTAQDLPPRQPTRPAEAKQPITPEQPPAAAFKRKRTS